MSSLYKATRPDGTDFRTATIDYAAALTSGAPVMHPDPAPRIGKNSGATAAGYLSVSVSPTDCTGFSWPCRLFRVEPVGRACLDASNRSKRRVRGVRVVEELPAHGVFGPQGVYVAAVLERVGGLSVGEADALAAAWDAARYAAWDATRDAAWAAARDAAWYAACDAARYVALDAARDAARDATRYAVLAVLVRDLIPTHHYNTLTMPWRTTIGPIHPDDPKDDA